MSAPATRIEDAVVERVRARLPQLDGNVAPATNLADDVTFLVSHPPAALVQLTDLSPAAKSADGDQRNPIGRPARRKTWFTVSVLMIASDLRTREAGDRATLGIHEMAHRVQVSLLGFVPEGSGRALEWDGTRQVGEDTERMLLSWQADFSAWYFAEEAP